MIIATRDPNLGKMENSNFKVEVLYLESEIVKWTDFVSVFRIFLTSNEDTLLVDRSVQFSHDLDAIPIKTVDYFDCFDVSPQALNVARGWYKLKHIFKINVFNLFCHFKPYWKSKVISSRLVKAAIRAKAIQEISNSVGESQGVRVNYLSKDLNALIFSRKAANHLIEFNLENTIGVDSVFRAVLRSSNLSFGSRL